MGYFVADDYYFADLPVHGMQELHRGKKYVTPDGVAHGARLKRDPDDLKKLGIWQWKNNPLQGTREFNGLRTLMAVIDNWDLKDSNNTVYQARGPEGPELVYLVSDLGASFGTAGFGWTKSGSGKPERLQEIEVHPSDHARLRGLQCAGATGAGAFPGYRKPPREIAPAGNRMAHPAAGRPLDGRNARQIVATANPRCFPSCWLRCGRSRGLQRGGREPDRCFEAPLGRRPDSPRKGLRVRFHFLRAELKFV